MLLVTDILIIVVLCLLIFQDLKFRAVSWPLLLMLFLFGVNRSVIMQGWEAASGYFAFNAGFVLIQLLCLTLYFSITQKDPVNITTAHLGWGDIFFFFAVAVFFPPFNFVLYFVTSLLLVAISFGMAKLILKKKLKTIPLAGGLAALMLLALVIRYSGGFDLYTHNLLENLI